METETRERILLVGGTGHLGREVLQQLLQKGYQVRLLSRKKRVSDSDQVEYRQGDLANPTSLRGCCDGCVAVISAAGGSLSLSPFKSRGSFFTTDYDAHRNLLTEARGAEIRRFVYVSVLPSEAVRKTIYVRAHEFFAQELLASSIPTVVIRPTGFFSTFGIILSLTRLRIFPLIGSGQGRTNPISETSLASLCVAALTADTGIIDAGGPEVLSRRDIAEHAFRARGLTPRFVHIPAGLVKLFLPFFRVLGHRYAELMNFLVRVQLEDVVAPKRDGQRLADFFRSLLKQRKSN